MKVKSSKLKVKSCSLKFKVFLLIFLITILHFALWTLNLSEAKAQTLSLSIYPPLLEVMIQPGKSITQVYKFTNGGETDLAFTSKVVPFEPADELGNVKLFTSEVKPGQNSTSEVVRRSSDFFSFQNADLDLGQKFIVRAGQEKEIVLKIKVPRNAPEDDYYATLLFETIPGVFMGGQSATQAQAKIGTNVLLTVSKDGKPLKRAEIIEFRPENCIFSLWKWCFLDSFDKPHFVIRIKNTGRAFLKTIGTITTKGWFGQEYQLDLLPENVLVNSARAINCAASNAAATFDSGATPSSAEGVNTEPSEVGSPCQLDSRFLLGRYRAKVEFGLDQLKTDYSAKTTFFALPIKLIFGLVIIMAIFRLLKAKIAP